jgi:D-lactate dehydrogenase (cytochrome)
MLAKTKVDGIEDYLRDTSNMPGGYAERVFVPVSVEEIQQVLGEANAARTPVTLSGARTGTVGAAIPFGGYVVSLEKLNKIKSVDREAMRIVVEPGVLLGDVQKAADAEGLFYPPDPTEWSCQIGGTVATNASGARSFKYGSTRDYVERLKVVLADGEVVDIRRGDYEANVDGVIHFDGRIIKAPTYERPSVTKNASGYFNAQRLDLIDLFIGSEGTLGVVVEVELRLLKKPEGLFSGIVFFEKSDEIAGFVDAARSKAEAASTLDTTLSASLIEYFDANSLRFIAERFPDSPTDVAGAIFFEQETTSENEDALFAAWNELLEKHNADLERSWFTTNDQDRVKMREFRHALPMAANERYSRSRMKKVSTDMAVPVENFPSFLKFYEGTLGQSGLEYIIFGHIGDCHLHLNIFPKDEGEAERARQIYGRCVAQAVMLGGTVSAEHGIGKLKRKYLEVMMGERYLNEMAAIKRVLDPNGILGRGNIFDEAYL